MDGSRKRLVFLSLAAVVAVIAGAIAIWSPQVPPAEATGAIGAVEKHRSVQIGAQDVVLADEAVMTESRIVFADYLKDATTLQNIGANLGSMVAYNRDSLVAANAALENHVSELQSRLNSRMADTLNAVQAAVENRANLGAAVAELNSIESSLAAKPNLQQMGELNSRLNNVVNELQSKGELAAAPALFAKLENELAAAAELAQKDALQASAALEAISAELQNKAMLGASLQNQMEYLASGLRQAAALENVQAELNAAMQLGAQDAALQSRLAAAVTELGAQAAQLESHAAENLQSRLNAHVEMNNRLNAMDAMLGSRFANRANLGAQALANVDASLASMDAALNSRLTGSMTVELQAIGDHLSNIDALASKLNNAANLGAQALQAKNAELQSRMAGSKLQAAAALDSRTLGSRLFNREALGSFQAYLQQAASLDAKLVGNVALMSRAGELQSRSGELASKVHAE